jgi:hypothetical protein
MSSDELGGQVNSHGARFALISATPRFRGGGYYDSTELQPIPQYPEAIMSACNSWVRTLPEVRALSTVVHVAVAGRRIP